MSNWRGIVTILEIEHLDKDGNIKWQDKNLKNLLHQEGEYFILKCCFDHGRPVSPPNVEKFPPDEYYFGLDFRTPAVTDTYLGLSTPNGLINEPITGGYTRAVVASTGTFQIAQVGSPPNGVYRATSQILTFNAIGANFTTVNNLFMTNIPEDGDADEGLLISSTPLSNQITLADGESLNLRMALSMQDLCFNPSC